ncbi:MAG: hypothetical protein U0236_09260 [Nitrospira sp.]
MGFGLEDEAVLGSAEPSGQPGLTQGLSHAGNGNLMVDLAIRG